MDVTQFSQILHTDLGQRTRMMRVCLVMYSYVSFLFHNGSPLLSTQNLCYCSLSIQLCCCEKNSKFYKSSQGLQRCSVWIRVNTCTISMHVCDVCAGATHARYPLAAHPRLNGVEGFAAGSSFNEMESASSPGYRGESGEWIQFYRDCLTQPPVNEKERRKVTNTHTLHLEAGS